MSAEDKTILTIYGPAGIGKTTLIATAINDDRTNPALLVNFEANTMAIRSKAHPVGLQDFLEGNTEPEEGKITVITIRDFDDFDPVIDYLGNDTVYKFVGVDSLSEIHYMAIRHAIATDPKKSRGRHDAPEWSDYNRAIQVMRELIRAFRDMDKHVIVTAHCKNEKDEMSGILRTDLGLIGQFKDNVPYLTHATGYYHKDGDGDRVLTFEQTNRLVAKDGTEGSLLESVDFVNPTVSKLLDTLGM